MTDADLTDARDERDLFAAVTEMLIEATRREPRGSHMRGIGLSLAIDPSQVLANRDAKMKAEALEEFATWADENLDHYYWGYGNYSDMMRARAGEIRSGFRT